MQINGCLLKRDACMLQVPDEAATAKKQAEADEKAKAEGKEGEKVEPVTKSEAETKWDWDHPE